MEILLTFGVNRESGIRLKQMKLYTFVAVDDTGTPVEIPK
jgi:hypothetical protein